MVDKLEPCAKCGATTGNDWTQCGGSCPMPCSPHHTPANGEQVERIVEELCAGRDGSQPGPMTAYRQGVRDMASRVATLSTPTEDARERVVPPVNGEPDPEWAAIKRAIDQFAGRVPKIGKHHALNTGHIADVVARLDAAGDAEAADTIVWQCWWRALDRERERFLLNDAAEQRSDAQSRVKVLEEALGAIQYEAERENGSWVHLKRCIATQARAALGNKETDRHG